MLKHVLKLALRLVQKLALKVLKQTLKLATNLVLKLTEKLAAPSASVQHASQVRECCCVVKVTRWDAVLRVENLFLQ